MSLRIGITGHTGSLGKEIIKLRLNYKYCFFKGDIRNKNTVLQWLNSENFDAIIHLAAIVPIKTVNKNKKKTYNENKKNN